MRSLWMKALVLLLVFAASPALAEPDTFYLGTGRDSGFNQTTGTKFSVNIYAPVTAGLLPGERAIPVGPLRSVTAGTTQVGRTSFAAGDLVMVLQATGLVPPATPGDSSPRTLDSTNAVGRWELARLDGVQGSTLYLRAPLMYSYAAGVTQVIRVPEFTTVRITSGQSIVAEPWAWDMANARGSGGVVAFLATDAITNDGAISAVGMGFWGGVYSQDSVSVDCLFNGSTVNGGEKGQGLDSTRYAGSTGRDNVANGAGGGVCKQSGGGGGGNGGSGGAGGRSSNVSPIDGGMGGARLIYSARSHLTFGGGGGSGHGYDAASEGQSSGGAGGGVIFVRGLSLSGGGAIDASGESGKSGDLDSGSGDGAGGGGAGGTVVLRLANSVNCNAGAIRAKGGGGGSANKNCSASEACGPGGGGGGGRILHQAQSGGSCVIASSDVNAGVAGTVDTNAYHNATPASADVGSAPYQGVLEPLSGGFPDTRSASVTITRPVSTYFKTPTVSPDGMLVIEGTAPTQSSVVVFLDGIEVGRPQTGAGTSFSVPVTGQQPDGLHEVQAAVVFPNEGLYGPLSATHYVLVDKTPPTPPVLTHFIFQNQPSPAASGIRITTTTPGVGGVAESGSSIAITINRMEANGEVTVVNNVAASAAAGSDGRWTWGWPAGVTELEDGQTYKLTAMAKDSANRFSNPSDALVFTVDLGTIEPVVTHIAGRSIASGLRVNSTTPSVQGTAEKGSTITVTIGSVTGTTVVGDNGVWTWAWPASASPLSGSPLGTKYTLSVSVRDPAKHERSMASPVEFYVDTSTSTPTVDSLVMPGGGTRPASSGMRINTKRPNATGTAEPGSTITLYIDGVDRTGPGPIKAGANGGWTWSFNGDDLALTPEPLHTLAVMTQDEAGNISPRSGTLFFYVDVTNPVLQVLRLGDRTASSGGMSISTQTPNVVGKSEPGSTITLSISENGAPVLDPARTFNADENGDWTWSWDTAATLPTDRDYSLDLTATDPAGNSSTLSLAFTVDTAVAPVITVAQVGNKLLASTDTSVSINTPRPFVQGTVEPGSTVTVKFSQGANSMLTMTTAADATSGLWSVAPDETQPELLDGSYGMTVEAKDKLGNGPVSVNVSVTVDSAPPSTEILTKPPVIGAPSTVEFTFNCTDAAGGSGCPIDGTTGSYIYQCSFNGNPFETCVSPYKKSGLAKDEYFLLVRALDNAGNVDNSPESHYWRVSDDNFSVDVADQPPDPTSNPNAIIDLQPNRNGAVTYSCSLKRPGGPALPQFGTCPADAVDSNNMTRLRYTSDLQGQYELTVRATENATGKQQIPSLYISWTYDSIAPGKPQISAPTTPFINTPTPTLSGIVLDPVPADSARAGEGLFVKIQLAGKTEEVDVDLSAKTWTHKVLVPLTDATYTATVTSRDNAGNVNTTPATVSFTVDTVLPRIATISGQPRSLTNDRNIDVAFVANEPSTYLCALDTDPLDGNFQTCKKDGSGSYTASGLEDGLHVLYIRATDRAQNVGPYTQVIWTLDTQPPETYVKKAPSQRTNSRDATFEFESEPGATFECALDTGGTGFLKCGEVKFTELSEGEHELHVRAVDRALNPDGSPSIHRWTVDVSPPAPPILLAPSEQGVVSTVLSTISGTAEADSTITVYLGDYQVGTATTRADGQWSTSLALSYPDGEYSLRATATDVATNTSLSSAARQVRVDVTPPETQISEGPQGRVDKTEATFAFRAVGEATPTTFQCSLDNGDFVPCSSPLSFEGLADGTHVLKVAAVDQAQNPDLSPATWTWTVDLFNDTRAIGGGLSCASTRTTESSFVAWLGLVGLLGLLARRRRI